MPRLAGLPYSLAVLLLAAALPAAEPPTADALFREGRSAMDRGDWQRAQSLLAESQRLEPAPGTLLNLAITERKLGRLAASWEHARSALDQLSASDDRRPVAIELFESLDKQVPRLVLRSAASLPQNAVVRIDDVTIRAAGFGVPLPVDPGAHSITITVPGYKSRQVRFEIEQGQRIERMLEPGDRWTTPSPVDQNQPSSNAFPWRTTGWVTAGVGAACLIGGGVTGYLAMQRNNTVESHCNGRYCDAVGTDAAAEGDKFATASTVTMVTGVALAVAGTLMIVMAPNRDAKPPRVGWIGSDGIRF